MPDSKIFDSWALLAWLLDQKAAADVETLLVKAEQEVDFHLLRLPSLPIRLVLPGEADIIAAAKLKAGRRISYADGFAVALAQREGASLVTGDPELRGMADVVVVEWIGH